MCNIRTNKTSATRTLAHSYAHSKSFYDARQLSKRECRPQLAFFAITAHSQHLSSIHSCYFASWSLERGLASSTAPRQHAAQTHRRARPTCSYQWRRGWVRSLLVAAEPKLIVDRCELVCLWWQPQPKLCSNPQRPLRIIDGVDTCGERTCSGSTLGSGIALRFAAIATSSCGHTRASTECGSWKRTSANCSCDKSVCS